MTALLSFHLVAFASAAAFCTCAAQAQVKQPRQLADFHVVRASSGSDVSVSGTGELLPSASGGSDVRYKGAARLTSSSGGGNRARHVQQGLPSAKATPVLPAPVGRQ